MAISIMIIAILEALPLNLVEILVALTLSSLIVILLGKNLAMLSLDTLHFQQTTHAEDSTLLALLLLQHQLQSSQATECTPSTELAYQPIENGLNIETLEDTRYISTQEQAQTFKTPQDWLKYPTETALLDDCEHIQKVPVLQLESILTQAHQFPLSVSLVSIKHYALIQDKLNLQINDRRKEGNLFTQIASFKASLLPNQNLILEITPENAHAPFSLHFSPAL